MPVNPIRRHFSELWPPILAPWTQYLVSCRAAFGGDLDKMIILAAIATMSLAYAGGASASYDDLKSGRKKIIPRPMNTLSLAEWTGIPRETVRRKVEDLVAMGWVVRSENNLAVSQRAATDLERISAMAFELVVHIHGVVAAGPRSRQGKNARKKSSAI